MPEGRGFESRHGNDFTYLTVLNFDFFTFLELPSREARQFFLRRHLFTKISYHMQKKSFIEDEEVKMIFRQIGFGATLGTAFLMVIYLGGLIAKLCSGM